MVSLPKFSFKKIFIIQSKKHFPGLDGLRGIAAMCVVFSHIGLSLSKFGGSSISSEAFAGLGVTLFFVLSGYLITFLLLQEKNVRSKISVRSFYIRRIIRIWPAYYLVIILSLAALYFFDGQIENKSSLFYYVFFLPNVPLALGATVSTMGHLWSIGVEEQFYAVWPWLLKHVKKLLVVFIGIVVAYMLLKVVFKYYGSNSLYAFWYYLRFDCMAIGGIGALLVHQKDKRLSFFYNKAVCWISIAVCAFSFYSVINIPLLKEELYAVVFLVIILNVSSNPSSPVKTDNSLLRYFGKISYGIYLYHPLMIYLTVLLCERFALQNFFKTTWYIPVYVIVIAFTIIIAQLSYLLMEQRFLRLKERFSKLQGF